MLNWCTLTCKEADLDHVLFIRSSLQQVACLQNITWNIMLRKYIYLCKPSPYHQQTRPVQMCLLGTLPVQAGPHWPRCDTPCYGSQSQPGEMPDLNPGLCYPSKWPETTPCSRARSLRGRWHIPRRESARLRQAPSSMVGVSISQWPLINDSNIVC